MSDEHKDVNQHDPAPDAAPTEDDAVGSSAAATPQGDTPEPTRATPVGAERNTSDDTASGHQTGAAPAASDLSQGEACQSRWACWCESLGGPVSNLEWIWVGLCFIVGCMLRMTNVAGRPLWTDEFTTLITVRRPLFESFFNLQDPQPPLYQLALRFWLLFSSDPSPAEWLVRGPALLAGCLCVVAAWWFARVLFGSTVAAITTLGMAINPLMIYYSREARPYSLFVLMAVVSMIFFYQLLRTGRRNYLIAYAVSVALMFYSHYYTVFYIAGQVTFGAAAMWLEPQTRRHFKAVLIGVGGGLAGSLPAIWMFSYLIGHGMPGANWTTQLYPALVAETTGELVGLQAIGPLCLIPVLAVFWPWRTPYDRGVDEASASPEGAVSTGGLSSWWVFRRPALYAAAWICFGLIVPFVGALVSGRGFVMRYALPLSIPVTALSIYYFLRLDAKVLALALILLFTYSAKKTWSEIKPTRGMREVVRFLHQHAGPTDHVVVVDWPFLEGDQRDQWVNPEVVGMKYYGYDDAKGPIKLVTAKQLGANQDGLLPEGSSYVVAYGSTIVELLNYLQQQGEYSLIREWTFTRRDRKQHWLKIFHIRTEPGSRHPTKAP